MTQEAFQLWMKSLQHWEARIQSVPLQLGEETWLCQVGPALLHCVQAACTGA